MKPLKPIVHISPAWHESVARHFFPHLPLEHAKSCIRVIFETRPVVIGRTTTVPDLVTH